MFGKVLFFRYKSLSVNESIFLGSLIWFLPDIGTVQWRMLLPLNSVEIKRGWEVCVLPPTKGFAAALSRSSPPVILPRNMTKFCKYSISMNVFKRSYYIRITSKYTNQKPTRYFQLRVTCPFRASVTKSLFGLSLMNAADRSQALRRRQKCL